jgi:hypothetical protein
VELSPAERRGAADRTIEGIVFLRLCEERGSEPPGRLLAVARASGVARQLLGAFRRASDRYHARLVPETRGRALPAAVFDDDALGALISTLYAEERRAELALLPADVLGQLYERSLELSRKASGVYYTPSVIVEHIVRGTVGRLLDSKTARQASDLRVLDPACGSGSFLLGAYQHLLDGCLEERTDMPRRKELLERCVFGLDLDARAVEITKLSLVLKLLEGYEGGEDASKICFPDLGRNIRCGNALIDADDLVGGEAEKEDTTRAFAWKRQFAEVFAGGGFDAVIGNPPYVSYGGRQVVAIPPAHARYFAEHYESAGWATAHSLFMERSAKLLARRFVSFIVPDQVGHLDGYRSLRGVLLRRGRLTEVRYWGEDVFDGVTTPSMTFVLDLQAKRAATRVCNADGTEQAGTIEGDAAWSFSSSSSLLDKLRSRAMSIRGWLADCGMRTTDAKRQVLRLEKAKGRFVPVLEGKQIGRYWCAPPEVAVRLDAGAVFKSRDEKYSRARFLIRQTAAYPIVGPREHAAFFRNSLHALYAPEGGLDVRYLVGVLNSKLLRFAYVKLIREASQRTFPQVKLAPLGQLPIRAIDLADAVDRAIHDRIVERVQTLLDVQRELMTTRPDGVEALRRRAAALDGSIDVEVYRLYRLEEGEISEVERVVGKLPLPPPVKESRSSRGEATCVDSNVDS